MTQKINFLLQRENACPNIFPSLTGPQTEEDYAPPSFPSHAFTYMNDLADIPDIANHNFSNLPANNEETLLSICQTINEISSSLYIPER